MSRENKDLLSSALHKIIKVEPFLGALLQELTFKFHEMVPTAGLAYQKKLNKFEVFINPKFFSETLTPEQRPAILLHEILHFTNGHIFRFKDFTDPNSKPQDRKLQNIAADIAINQYIKNLPEQAVTVDKFKLKNGQTFPKYRIAEEYLKLLKDNEEANEEMMKKLGSGEGTEEGELGQGETLDKHFWEDLSEEEKQDMLQEAKKVLERTIEKTNYGYSELPDSIKDLLKTIEVSLNELNYKGILRRVIQRTLVSNTRKNTWNRPSRRYGTYAPGTTDDVVPELSIYIDTSGSISLTEMNQFITVLRNFVKFSGKKYNLHLWHTNVYYSGKHKLKDDLSDDIFQSGGTDVDDALQNVIDTQPNLAIIFTDGMFSRSDLRPATQVLWIISEGGDKNHPNKDIGETILLEGIK